MRRREDKRGYDQQLAAPGCCRPGQRIQAGDRDAGKESACWPDKSWPTRCRPRTRHPHSDPPNPRQPARFAHPACRHRARRRGPCRPLVGGNRGGAHRKARRTARPHDEPPRRRRRSRHGETRAAHEWRHLGRRRRARRRWPTSGTPLHSLVPQQPPPSRMPPQEAPRMCWSMVLWRPPLPLLAQRHRSAFQARGRAPRVQWPLLPAWRQCLNSYQRRPRWR